MIKMTDPEIMYGAEIKSLISTVDALHKHPGADHHPSQAAISDAMVFISLNLLQGPLLLPEVSVATDGELNFCWETFSSLIDLGFYGDGTYSYYARNSDGKEFMADDAFVTNPLPLDVLRIISLYQQTGIAP